MKDDIGHTGTREIELPWFPRPWELVEQGPALLIYPRFALDTTRRSGVPLAGIKLFQKKSGAARGEKARYIGWNQPDRDALAYACRAVNAHDDLVAALRNAIACLDRDGPASAIASLNTEGRAALKAMEGSRG